ncbi:flavin reductase family protein [Natranaerobius thermophilus]|uniref:Flavin reductase domain protein FMN-binding n=1 Tax=Natranaerobius thermophilus (strain ATCC BAA-1301 / DSM 18059 / JW/NM-WN-LF) TaxID=457570 RepID=B2A716_NATTJ|nr:flavin reductase family protein [Natranaerobius thermophilus]ACB85607.1 flavin reductase domain protein FMN-binding [Natranaerobius thermophilus JW/NM-WN-LF]
MQKKVFDPGTYLFPVPAVMVSCAGGGQQNIITIAWTGTVNSKPPMVGISITPQRYSFDLIKETGEFVVNIPDDSLVKETDYCGCVSGRKVDKFKDTGLTSIPAKTISVPMIGEAPVNLECKVVAENELGSHHQFIGEVKKVHIANNLIDEQGKLDIYKGNLISFGGKAYYQPGKQIYGRGESMKQK